MLAVTSGYAEVAELADAQDLGSCGRKVVEVQLLSSAIPFVKRPLKMRFLLIFIGTHGDSSTKHFRPNSLNVVLQT